MEKRKLIVLTICGTGGVTSSVAKVKVEKILKEVNMPYKIISTQASDAKSKVDSIHPDLIVSTTPISVEKVPVIVATAFLTGIGEEEVKKEILKIVKEIK